MARLVHTHSTYVEGLISVLKHMSKDKSLKTITPGVIMRVKGRSDKLSIKITREVNGGFKLIARKGNSAQDLYIITDYSKNDLEEKIKKSIGKIH